MWATPPPVDYQPGQEQLGNTKIIRYGYAIDGDTIQLSTGTRVRLLGIDTPEYGEPNYVKAQNITARYIRKGFRIKPNKWGPDFDVYYRSLRYVKAPGKRDLGAKLLRKGVAVPKYDSTDGYASHPKQTKYYRIWRTR